MSKSARFWAFIAGILALRLLGMAFVPLAETTESRYAEIGRLMLVNKDWITPWFDTGVPFWGKPPLAFWVQALSFKLFGVNELAARLPFWLATLATLGILWHLACESGNRSVARYTLLIYCSSALVYIAAGAILTDPFLVLGTTWSMAAYYMAAKQPTGFWRYGFFLGLSIGLLAKGPLAGVITMGPIVLWALLVPASRTHIKALPWLRGTALTLLIILPWYIAAELKTPGFLNYFIIGEHLMRFIDPGWVGDLYGSAHKQPKGTIWLQWLMASFPWGLIGIGLLIRQLFSAQGRPALKQGIANPLVSYLVLWTLFTPLFFTAAGNVLWTYLLPTLPAFSLLLGLVIVQRENDYTKAKTGMRFIPYLVPAITLGIVVLVQIKPDMLKSEKGMIEVMAQLPATEAGSAQFSYLDKPPFSARFYSAGKARETTFESLRENSSPTMMVAIPKKSLSEVEQKIGKPLHKKFENRRYVLVELPEF